jgi:hypothetical protein
VRAVAEVHTLQAKEIFPGKSSARKRREWISKQVLRPLSHRATISPAVCIREKKCAGSENAARTRHCPSSVQLGMAGFAGCFPNELLSLLQGERYADGCADGRGGGTGRRKEEED